MSPRTQNDEVQEKEVEDSTTTVKQKRKYTRRKGLKLQQLEDSTTGIKPAEPPKK